MTGTFNAMRKWIAVLALLVCTHAANAAEVFRVNHIMLLQPQEMLQARVPCVEAFAEYLERTHDATKAAASRFAQETPTSGFIVVAVRPGGQSKAWVDFKPALDPADEAMLVDALEKVVPFEARMGTVLATTNVSLFGADADQRRGPAPESWRKFSEQGSVEITALIDRAWPVVDAPQAREGKAPTCRG